jgi:CubicO group peptidase (beta-lactamase class C family)
MTCWLLCVVAAAAHQLVGAASPQTNAPPLNLDERVDAIVRSEILAKGVPGVSVAVMRDGKMLLERAWGLSDVEKKTPADASTTSQIASVTKPFTAVLVLKQVDRGRLSLSDPLGKHLPGVSAAFDTFTIEQMLNHTSGLAGDYRNPEQRLENKSAAELVAMAAATPLANKPGTTYVYSNTGYMLLAVLAEKLYGKSYAAALRDEIAVPLGLTTLAQCAEPKPGEATGSRRMPDGKLVPPPGIHHSQLLGAGGICATAGDLVKWTHALHTGRLLSAAAYTGMTTPRDAAVGANYGFGLWVRPAPWGSKAIVAGGQTQNGHTAELQWYPEQSLAVALLYNVAPRLPGLADLIPRVVLGVPLPEKSK